LVKILSRNPVRLEVDEIQDLTKPNTISVNKIELKSDQAVLKNLADKQKNDPRLRIIREKAENDPADNKHRIEEDVIFRRDRLGANWKSMLPECLEAPIIQYVYTSLGHAGVDKCDWEINQSFHLKNVGRKVLRLIASCDICQRVKHPNRSLDIKKGAMYQTNQESCSRLIYMDCYRLEEEESDIF